MGPGLRTEQKIYNINITGLTKFNTVFRLLVKHKEHIKNHLEVCA